jgi:transposase
VRNNEPTSVTASASSHRADSGRRGELPSTREREEIRSLRREVKELRRANEILKSASVFFAKELDPDRTK